MKMNIRKYRLEKGIKLELLAKRTGISKSALNDYERELYSPSIETLEKIAKSLGVRITDLFESEYK